MHWVLIAGCGLSPLRWAAAPLELQRAAFTAVASLVGPGFSSCCPWPWQPWLMGSVPPWQAGSSWTGDQTTVLCIARQLANHGTTREARESASFLRGRGWRQGYQERSVFRTNPRKADVSSVCLLLSTHRCPDDLGLRILYFHCPGHVVGTGSHKGHRRSPAEAMGKLVEVSWGDRLYVWRVSRDAAEGIPCHPWAWRDKGWNGISQNPLENLCE